MPCPSTNTTWAKKEPPPLLEQGGACMDDTYLWSHDHKHLQAALRELANTGLPSTARKRQSPTATKQGGIGGCRATCLPFGALITVLGSPLSNTCPGGRDAEEGARRHKHVLCASTDLERKMIACKTFVRNSALFRQRRGQGSHPQAG